jgi:acyltransferase
MDGKKDKIAWIDPLRGLAILAVVLGHMATPLSGFIYSWHIPLFFFISGYLFNVQTPVSSSLKKDFRRFILPYFIFGSMGILAEITKRALWPGYPYVYSSFSLSREIYNLIVWMDESQLHHYGFVLWFLPALFWSRSLSLVLIKYIKSPLLIIPAAISAWLIFSNNSLVFPFALDKGILCLIFLISGYYFRYFLEKIWPGLGWILCLTIILISPIPVQDLANKIVGSPVNNLIYAYSVILLLVTLFKKVSGLVPYLALWGVNTMYIFVIHPYVNNFSYFLISLAHLNWVWEIFISVIMLASLLTVKKYVKNAKYTGPVNWV